MVDHEKPLPLIPYSDQIDAIKHLNRRKHEERDVEIQASISPSLAQPNLKFLPFVDAKIDVEEARIERFEKGGV